MVARWSPRLLTYVIIAAVGAAALVLTLRDVRLASSQAVTLVARQSDAAVPIDDPSSDVWSRAAPVDVTLSGQNVVPPKAAGESSATARALHDGERLYVRLEWKDDLEDASTIGQTSFSDAAAVQFPVAQGEQVPPFCMGDASAPVNIWHWKASWQPAEGQELVDLEEAFPNIQVEQYPFEDEDVFAPSSAAGNTAARVDRRTPVDNLLAGSFGTLTEADDQVIQGRGEWDDGRWRVVFARDLTIDGEYAQFAVGERSNVAFAVWDGDRGERDGMKSVSQFLVLDVSPEIAEAGGGGIGVSLPRGAIGALIAAGLALVLMSAVGYLTYIRRRGW